MTPTRLDPFCLARSQGKITKRRQKLGILWFFMMPTPVAKGLIITVSALVAAGIAVYESPQFRQWVDNSRRKIALALHNLGDEIQPRDSASPAREDISMTEEVGEAAQERRRIAREEIQRRSALFEARRRKRECRPGSFDTLVDEDGHLHDFDSLQKHPDTQATSTAVDLTASLPAQRSLSGDVPVSQAAEDQARIVADENRLHIDLPSPGSRSSTLLDLTPTSEVPDHGNLQEIEQSSFFSVASQPHSLSSSHTENQSEGYYQPHPNPHQDLRSPFADISDLGSEGFTPVHQSRPSTPSTADGSFSHVYETAEDASSDGTLSDLGRSTEGVATPASWSEVGSVISDDDANHHALQ